MAAHRTSVVIRGTLMVIRGTLTGEQMTETLYVTVRTKEGLEVTQTCSLHGGVELNVAVGDTAKVYANGQFYTGEVISVRCPEIIIH